MVSLWVRDSYFNNKKIKISDVEIMNDEFGSSGKFASRVRSKCVGHKTYTSISNNFCPKPTKIHGTAHKS